MNFQVKVEYGREKFVKFYVEADVVDGKVLRYSFSSLVEDIRRTCGSLRHHTSSTLRIRYKDEDGDFVNLNEDDTDNFQEIDVCSCQFSRWRAISESTSESQWARFTCSSTNGPGKKKKAWTRNVYSSAGNWAHSSLTWEQLCECRKSRAIATRLRKSGIGRKRAVKKVLLSSAKEELVKATAQNEALTPLSAIRSRICGNCHESGHTKPKCVSPPCPSHDACGLRDKHPELKLKILELQKEIKRLQQEHCDAESKLKAFCESRVKASTSFFAVMRPRLKVRNLIKYSDRVSLDRDLLILEKALNGKIPEFDASEDWRLPILIEQYRNRNVDIYLNSVVDCRSSVSKWLYL